MRTPSYLFCSHQNKVAGFFYGVRQCNAAFKLMVMLTLALFSTAVFAAPSPPGYPESSDYNVVTNENFTISWSKSTGLLGGWYQFQKVGSSSSIDISASTPTKTVSETVAGVYVYKVRACKGEFNCSSWRETSPVTVTDPPPQQVPPPTISPNNDFEHDDSVTVSIQALTGATIRYTTNGGSVTTSSPLYSAPFTLMTSSTVRARAYKSGMTASEQTEKAYTVKQRVADPVVNPSSEIQTGSATVSISSATSNTLIYYTTNNLDVDRLSDYTKYYEGPFNIDRSTTIKAKAYKAGMNGSSQVAKSYKIKAQSPAISPSSSTHIESVLVSLIVPNGTTVRYTTDGNDVTTSSTAYSVPFTLTQNTTVKARAFKSFNEPSDLVSKAYTVLKRVAAPTFTPNGGTHTNSKLVSINAPSGASIRYTTDGSDVTTNANLYSSPINVVASSSIKAKAYKSGMAESLQSSANFTVKTGNPVISPSGGSFTGSVSVSLTGPSGSTIRYSTDGADVTSASSVYSEVLTLNKNTIIKAKAFKSGQVESNQVSEQFNVRVSTPSINPAEGTYTGSVDINFDVPSGANVRYTTDGSDVTDSSTLYSGVFSLTKNATIKAKAFKSGMSDSVQVSKTFTIRTPSPSIQPVETTHIGSVNVFFDVPAGASVRYTVDGSNVSTNSAIYESMFTVSQNTLVKAKAYRSGMAESEEVSRSFIVELPLPGISPNGDTFVEEGIVTLSSIPGATIRYTMNGNDVDSNSPVYGSPIAIENNTTIKVRAFKSGMQQSQQATANFAVLQRVASPQISPNGGRFDSPPRVTLSAPSNAEIRYTTDGSEVNSQSNLYSGPFELGESSRLRVKAFENGMAESLEVQADFTIIRAGALSEIPDADYTPVTPPQQNLVGELQGKAGVSGGAFSYSLPISVAPGINGVQPTISLSYSSQSGIGSAGFGWNLGAGSKVSRCPNTYPLDGKNQSVQRTDQDKLCLDGQRLVLVAGSYGEVGAVYELETSKDVTVFLKGSNFANPASYFEVRYKNGMLSTYAKQLVPINTSGNLGLGSVPVDWLITKEEDVYGNNVQYEYQSGNGYRLLTDIFYTGRHALKGDRRIQFEYEDDADNSGVEHREFYSYNYKTVSRHRLKKINLFIAGVKSDFYELEHNTDQTLKNVKHCFGSECLQNSFTYKQIIGESFIATDNHIHAGSSDGQDRYLLSVPYKKVGDFDGDGIEELSFYQQDADMVKLHFLFSTTKEVKVAGEITEISDAQGLSFEYHCNPTQSINCVVNYSAFSNAFSGDMDFDYDGRKDIVYINTNAKVAIANSYEKTSTELPIDGKCEIPGYAFRSGLISCDSFVLDLNQDGRKDLLVASGGYAGTGVVHKAYLRSAIDDSFVYAGQFNSGGLNGYQLADIDGDGRIDLVDPLRMKWVRMLVSGTNVSFTTYNLAFASQVDRGATIRSVHTHMADLNGDGLDDFLTLSLRPNNTSNRDLGWYVVLNEGGGAFSDLMYTGYAEPKSSNDASETADGTNSLSGFMKAFDYNGDGRTDFLVPRVSAVAYDCVNYPMNANNCYDEHETFAHWRSDVWRWKVWQTSANGVGFEEIILDDDILGALNTTTLIDYNGDGELDIATNIGYDSWLTWSFPDFAKHLTGTHVYLRNENKFQHKLLESVETDFGEKLRVDYANLNSKSVDGKPIYSVNPITQNFPYVNFGSSMVVVDQLKTDNGVGGKNTSRYKYADARFHYQGRGFQGFREIRSEQVEHDLTDVSEFYQYFPMSGQVFSQKTVQTSTGALISHSYAVDGSEITAPSCAYAGERIKKSYDINNSTSPLTIATTKTVNDENCNLSERSVTVIDKRPDSTKATSDFDWITHTAIVTSEIEPVAGKLGAYRKVSETSTMSVEYAADERGVTLPSENTTKSTVTIYAYANQEDIAPFSIEVTGGDRLLTSMRYDEFGHVTRKTFKGTGLDENPRWTETLFTSDGYFPESEANSEWGESIKSVTYQNYYERYGLPRRTIDANEVVTEFSYNVMGVKTGTHVQKHLMQAAPPVFSQLMWCDEVCVNNAVYYRRTTQVGAPSIVQYYDSHNREIQSETDSFGGAALVSTQSFDPLGRLVKVESSTGEVVTYSGFDVLGRPGSKATEADPQNYTAVYTYSGFRTDIAVTGDRTLIMSRTSNSRDQLMRTKDANGEYGYFAYDGAGNPTLIRDVKGNDIRAAYNGLGFKTSVQDPNRGLTEYTHNGLGELLSQTDANMKLTVFQLDDLGRVKKKTQGSDISFWDYDIQQYGVLDGDSRGQHSRTYDYDSFGRVTGLETIIDGVSYHDTWAYDGNYGRLKGHQSPNSHILATTYDSLGFAERDYLPDQFGGVLKPYAEFISYTVTGLLETIQFGNGLYQTTTHHLASGMVDAICAGESKVCDGAWSAQSIDYRFNEFGNLIGMTDFIGDINREYFYDDLHRLDYVQTTLGGNGAVTTDYDYDAAGNLTLKSDYASDYLYGNAARDGGGNAGPNAVRSITKNGNQVDFQYDNAGNLLSGDGLNITYDGNYHTKTVTRDGANITFFYDASGQRYKQVKIKGNITTTTLYIGSYERVSYTGTNANAIERVYLGSHTILTNVLAGSDDTPQISHIVRDRLGSVSLVLDGDKHVNDGHVAQNLVIERRDYDAFGKATLLPTGMLPSVFMTTDRGFTDHEHLLDVELIHMNGRAFDYNMGRFLSVDPFIQGVDNSQSINPYSYILNNPLSGIDPSGYSRIDKSRDLGSFIERNLDEDFLSTQLNADDKLTVSIDSSNGKTSVKVDVTNKDGVVTASDSFTKAGRVTTGGSFSFEVVGKGGQKGSAGQGAQQGVETSGSRIVNGKTDLGTDVSSLNRSGQEFVDELEERIVDVYGQLINRRDEALANGDNNLAQDMRNAITAMEIAEYRFQNVTGPNGAEAEATTRFRFDVDGNVYAAGVVITFFQGAIAGHKNGSKALRSAGYHVDLRAGLHYIRGLVGHEVGHTVPSRVLDLNNKPLKPKRREQYADDFLQDVYPGQY